MVDFSLSDPDRAVLDGVAAEAKAGEKYARHYDDHEEEVLPKSFPEASSFPPIQQRLRGRSGHDTPMLVLQVLMRIEREAHCGVPLRQPPTALGNAALNAAGTAVQKARWGHLMLAMSITEPGAGSDTKAIQTTARLDGDAWVLNGDKIFVTNGVRCDGTIVWATVDKSAGRGGIKSFLVMKGTPGFELVRKEKKLGIRASDTAAYAFRDCRVPRDHLIGGDESVPRGEREGSASYKGVLKTFNMTRPFVAAGGIGKALGAFRFARDRLAEEGIVVDVDEGPTCRSAAAQALLDIEADIEAATLTVLRAAWLASQGKPNNLEASVAKAKGGELCRSGPQRAMDALGAMSLSHDYPIEQYLRDGRITDIYEGTGQIQRLVIAREILGYSSEELT
ncbi:acyl-CoA dehydrogenase family protein [Bradyrhizobium ivorense]|uniref:acyl-CoA dehydrogenase family protein n=1 Tax=Bradyrhizobium ivorense TaxID=2511166 RepID=UPI0010B00F30|nr:acyl-CoA dehydrogenase family protein [Bradyrhizobium ivorense]VIO67248.1 Acyl-CoA dehydrogenase, short-chain specific [Bradyrhizobium ivorense]